MKFCHVYLIIYYFADILTIQYEADAPVITGGLSSYEVGDLVELNCSTTSLESTLDWYINEEKVTENIF